MVCSEFRLQAAGSRLRARAPGSSSGLPARPGLTPVSGRSSVPPAAGMHHVRRRPRLAASVLTGVGALTSSGIAGLAPGAGLRSTRAQPIGRYTDTHDEQPAPSHPCLHDGCDHRSRRAPRGRCAGAARLPRHPGGCRGSHPAVVLAEAIGRIRPRHPCRVALLARHADVSEWCALLHAAPGLEARGRRSAWPRRGPARHGALIVEPAARLPGRPVDRHQHALHGRLLPGAWPVITRVEVATPAVPVQRGRAQRDVRRRHARGQGIPAAGQGRILRRRAGDPGQDHGRHQISCGRWPDGRHAGSAGRGGRCGAFAVAVSRARGRNGHAGGPEGLDHIHDELDGCAPAVRSPEAVRTRRHGTARSRARARHGVAGGASDEDQQLGPVLRGHRRVLEHGDQRRHDGAGPCSRNHGAIPSGRRTRAPFSTGSSVRSPTKSSRGTASRPSTSRPPTRCRATATPRGMRRSS